MIPKGDKTDVGSTKVSFRLDPFWVKGDAALCAVMFRGSRNEETSV